MTIILTYDSTLSRVVIAGSDLPDGFVIVERSANQNIWTTVRGGNNVEVESGSFQLYDYEFFAGVENFYRVRPSVVASFTAVSTDQTDGDDYAVPFGINELTFEMWGGGGRGQGNQPPSATNSARPGGGGGAYARSTIAVGSGETLQIRVGKGANAADDTNDGTSSFVKRNEVSLVEAVGGVGASGFTAAGTGGDAGLCIGQYRQSGGDGGLRESEIGAGGGGGGSAFVHNDGLVGAVGAAGVGGAGGDGQGDGGSGGAQEPGLLLPGTVGNYASTPDNASLDITGDLDVRALVDTLDWTPAAESGLVGKWTTTGNQRSYLFTVLSTGQLRLWWSVDGATNNSATSTVSIPISSGPLAVRATIDVDNGAAGRTVTFYTAPAAANALDFGPWTLLGTAVVTAGVTSIFNSTAVLEVGTWSAGTSGPFNGISHHAQVRNGISGTVVANPKFYEQATDTVSFADSPGRLWSVNGTARIINESTAGQNGIAPGGGGGGQGNNQVFNPGLSLGGDGAAGQVNVYSWYGYPFETQGLTLSGASGDYASTPDTAVLDIAGDIDLRAEITPDSWNTGTQQAFLTKYDTTGNQRSYYFRISTTGVLTFLWSADGAAFMTANSSVAPTPAADGRLAVRVTLDVDNGLAQNVTTFYTAPTLAGPWTQLGTTVVNGGTTSIFNSTADLVAGGRNNGTVDNMAGVIHGLEVRNGINGTEVANPDFDAQAPGTTSFVDDAGRTWTLFGNAEIQGGTEFESSITPILTDVWLKSIKYPFLNRIAECTPYSGITRPFRGGVFDVQGRSMPIAITDLKGSRRWSMTIVTRTLEQARDMDLVIAANQVLFIHVPAEDPDECDRVSAVPGGYVVIGDSVQSRAFPGSQIYEWILPLTEVAQPDSNVVPTTLTWGTVFNLYGSWEDLIASNPTWIDLFATVGSPDDLVVL